MFVRLQPARDAAGDYYRVNSAFLTRNADDGDRKGRKKLWDGREPTSSATGTRTAFAATTGDESRPASANADRQSRGQVTTRGAGIDRGQLDRTVGRITHAWHSDKPQVTVVDDPEQLPASARAELPVPTSADLGDASAASVERGAYRRAARRSRTSSASPMSSCRTTAVTFH